MFCKICLDHCTPNLTWENTGLESKSNMRSRHYSETIQFGDFHFRLDRKHTYPDSFQKAKNWFDGKSKFSPFHCRKGRSSLFLFAFFFFKVCLPLIKCIPYIHSVKKRENHSHWKIFHEINSLVNQLLFTIFFPEKCESKCP